MATFNGAAVVPVPNPSGAGRATPPSIRGLGFLTVGAVPVDPNPPTITILSPTPGVEPGQPGGFPLDPELAKFTPVRLRITDMNGLRLVMLKLQYKDESNVDIGENIVIYDNVEAAFKGSFQGTSTIAVIVDGYEFVILPAPGWLGFNFRFSARVVDTNGNLA